MDKKNDISRKQFLKVCGTVIAGGGILGVSSMLIRKNFQYGGGNSAKNLTAVGKSLHKDSFVSPYKLVTSFGVPDAIEAFELSGDNLFVAAAGRVYVYDRHGSLQNNFVIGENLRDMVVDRDEIYMLFPSRIAVYDRDGGLLREWEACSEQSDYCSMTIAEGFVFATDVANKNICKYAVDGRLVKFINSPEGFVIPSYTYGIAYTNGILYCSNSGRHRIEKYTLDGDYLGAFGQAGGAVGMFCGCCNPVHIASASTGEIITSEKGNPRISCYGSDGKFRSLLMDAESLGGGHKAYDVKACGNQLFVAGNRQVSIFRYDTQAAVQTDCAACGVDCPLKKG